jgi:CMP/dCMP kinase
MPAKASGKRNIVIAISGPPGVGTTSVAKAVAKKLHLPLLVLGRQQKAFVKGKTKKESEAALLSWKTKVGRSVKTHNDRDRMQVERALKGNVVICSKLAVYFLKGITPYRFWIHAPLSVRAKRASGRDNVPYDVVRKELSEREAIERKEWKRMYGFDYFSQGRKAALSINSSQLTLPQTVRKVIEFMKAHPVRE